MFDITRYYSSERNRCNRIWRIASLLLLVSAMLLSLANCSSAEDDGSSGLAEAQRFTVAIPPDLEDVVSAVHFTVTDENGNSREVVVPLVEQGLPDSIDPNLSGHQFADWFVVLNPGTYDVVATPLAGNDEPSDICSSAGGTVSVFDGVTTEIMLVSNCGSNSGGLDVALVFNHNPYIEKLVIAPNKFLCIGKHVVLNARASDDDGDELSYHWQVTDTPDGVDMDDYLLQADSPPAWQAKFSATESGRYELTLSVADGYATSSLSFPIYVSDCDVEETASVRGVKWQDNNGNAERDTDEPGLAGVVIYSDLNGNREFDPGEPFTVSMRDDPDTDFDEAGRYWLEGLRPGSHSIREVVPDGFVQTFPPSSTAVSEDEQSEGVNVTPGAINVSLAAGEVHDAVVSISFDFLCFRPFDIDVVADAAAAGVMQNLTGVLENGCGGDISMFEIRLTGDGGEHNFDLQFVDDEFGGILGTIPVQITAPGNDGAHQVILESGVVIEGLDFGNRNRTPESASIHGRKWLDSNENGEHDTDEPGLPGVTIYSDLNHNGALDAGEPNTLSMSDDPITDFDESGFYWLEDLQPGEHVIREVVPDGFIQTFPLLQPVEGNSDTLFDVTPDAINITLAPGSVLETQVSLTIAPFCFRPYEIDLQAPLAPSDVFQNLSDEIVNSCGGDTSTFDIRLTHPGGVVTFDIDFVDAESGSVLASIPVQISEAGSGFHTIMLEAGDAVDGVDFGNAEDL